MNRTPETKTTPEPSEPSDAPIFLDDPSLRLPWNPMLTRSDVREELRQKYLARLASTPAQTGPRDDS